MRGVAERLEAGADGVRKIAVGEVVAGQAADQVAGEVPAAGFPRQEESEPVGVGAVGPGVLLALNDQFAVVEEPLLGSERHGADPRVPDVAGGTSS